jgi:hypothetical protein
VVSSTRRGRHLIGNGFPLDSILGEECAVGYESPHLRRPPLQLQARPGMCGDNMPLVSGRRARAHVF